MTTTAPDGMQAVIDTARESVAPHQLEVGQVYAVRDHAGGMTTIDLTGDQYLASPARKHGTTTVWDVPAFLAYHGKHADDATEVYADVRRLTVTAVLDAHEVDAARWGRHRLHLELRKTPEWLAWAKYDGDLLGQEQFAEHLEDNNATIATPTSAEMLEIAQSIQATNKVDFKSSSNLGSGQRGFEYTETVGAKAGQKGQLTIPTTFEIGVIPFEGSEAYRMSARFRYRISDTGLKLGYRLDRPHEVLRAAFGDVVTAINGQIDTFVMNGSPA